MIVDSFSGPAAMLPPGKRGDSEILACLRTHPFVSVWDMSELAWLRIGIQSLERRGLIRDDRKEPYPWIRYTVLAGDKSTETHKDGRDKTPEMHKDAKGEC